MGWRYQHDIKVKKVWKTVALTAAVLCAVSCTIDPTKGKLDDYTIIEGENSQKVNVWNKGDVYLADYNTNREWISFANIAKPEKIKERTAEEQENVGQKIEIGNKQDYFSSLLDKKNEELIANLKKNSKSRSAYATIDCEVQKISANVGDKKEFYSYYDMALEIPVSKEAECKVVGEHCIIWNIPVEVDKEYPESYQLDEASFKKIAEKFDYIYEMETSFVGTHQYTKKAWENLIDSHDKIEIILTDICGDAKNDNGMTYVGYFSQNDVIEKKLFDDNGEEIKDKSGKDYNYASNETQCIFIDSPYFKTNEQDTYSTIVHEFQHLLNFCYKQQFNGNVSDRWFTEMMSMLTEDAFTKYLKSEIINTPQVRLINWEKDFGYLESPFIWYSLSDIDNIGKSYSATYALGAFLSRNYGGLELIHQMAINEYVDMYAVDDALSKAGYSYNKIYDDLNNFNIVMENYPYVLINLDNNEAEDIATVNKSNGESYITLNRAWTSSSFPELSLDAIKLLQDLEIKDSNGNTKIINLFPIYLNPKKQYGKTFRVYYGGFALWYVGNNIKKFNVEVPDSHYGYYKVLYPQNQE